MSNVEQLHKERKRAQAKEAKTFEASAAAHKAAKLKVERDAARASNRGAAAAGPLSIMRKHLWFEKFRWFLSSEGYIVIVRHKSYLYARESSCQVLFSFFCIVHFPSPDPVHCPTTHRVALASRQAATHSKTSSLSSAICGREVVAMCTSTPIYMVLQAVSS